MSKLTALTPDEVVIGKHTLNLYGLQNSAAAAPVSQSQLRGIQEVNMDPANEYDEVFHQGGGDDSLQLQTKARWNGSLVMEGALISQIATIMGITLGSSGQYGLSLTSNHESVGFISRKIYKKDNASLLYTQVYPDIKLDDISLSGPIDRMQITLPIYAERSPYLLSGAVPVYDVFTGDGSTTTFTPSSTPVKIEEDLNAPNNDLITIYDFFVKVWASGDRVGTLQTSGYSITPATPVLTFDTAPASGEKIGMLYAAAV